MQRPESRVCARILYTAQRPTCWSSNQDVNTMDEKPPHSSTSNAQPLTYDAFWAEDAKPLTARVDARLCVVVPERFALGPLLRCIERSMGSFNKEHLQEFLATAVEAWMERYQDGTTPASPLREEEVRSLVPAPRDDEQATKVWIGMDERISPEAFGRVLATRFRANGVGRALAFREAILEALIVARNGEDRRPAPISSEDHETTQ